MNVYTHTHTSIKQVLYQKNVLSEIKCSKGLFDTGMFMNTDIKKGTQTQGCLCATEFVFKLLTKM